MEADAIEIKAKLRSSLDSVEDILNGIGKGIVARTKTDVSYLLVEKKDIKGNPTSFFIIVFKKDRITILYSLPEDVSVTKRKWEVLRLALPIIEAVANEYDIKSATLISLVDIIIEELERLATNDIKKAEIENSRLMKMVKDCERKLSVYKRENEKLTQKLFEITSKMNEMGVKLKKYEAYSDEVLKVKVLQWIKDNEGVIDIPKFSRFYGVPETKVEEIINSLIESGHIKPI